MKKSEFLEIEAKIAGLNALNEKCRVERLKSNNEDKCYPFIIGGSVILAVIALIKLF